MTNKAAAHTYEIMFLIDIAGLPRNLGTLRFRDSALARLILDITSEWMASCCSGLFFYCKLDVALVLRMAPPASSSL